uniref:Leishmanolysin-like peptidase n=2 Tax=Petromyzon marinus TaxID=7757 RepID=A0AAJ7TIC6_PETMA|nr:leishmanolysin-like peptidase isoform X1 [Petromyzon marinus]
MAVIPTHLLYLVLHLLPIVFIRPGSCHVCRHAVPGRDQLLWGVTLPGRQRELSRRSPEPTGPQRLRVRLIYDSSVDSLPNEKRDFIKMRLFPEAVDYIQSALFVRSPGAKILLNRYCATNHYFMKHRDPHRYCQSACAETTRCGPVTVPDEHLQQCRVCDEGGRNCGSIGPAGGPGEPDADYVLYVSALGTDRCQQEGVVAYAAYCQLEAQLDRPIAGYANLCPDKVSLDAGEQPDMLSTVKHEVIHALGFSAGLFAFYRDDDGQPLTPRYGNGLPPFNDTTGLYQWSERVARRVSRRWAVRGGELSHLVTLLVTPRVVEEAREHFGCLSLEGLELENQGGSGTELNHWEKRLLENEAMTGSHTQRRIFSRFTLALMEDTGWYHANYSHAEALGWGRGLGCVFAMQSCKAWMDHRSDSGLNVAPFCKEVRGHPLRLGCGAGRSALVLCNLQRYTNPLPTHYQYLDFLPGVSSADMQLYGGLVEIADYCPFSQEFSWHEGGAFSRGSACQNPRNQPDERVNYGLETYGQESACIEQGSTFHMQRCGHKRAIPDWGSGCYRVTCSPKGGVTVWIGGVDFPCSHAGQAIRVAVRAGQWLHVGSLRCPPCSEVCPACPPDMEPRPGTTRQLETDACPSFSPGLTATLWMLLLLLNTIPHLLGVLCVEL